MTVSSADEPNFYTTPELRNLLMATKRLRIEISRLGVRVDDTISYNRLLKNMDALEESLSIHFKEIQMLERVLETTASTRLTKKQRMLLRWLSEEYSEETVYTTLIERISKDLSIPKSTVRWNLRGLRDAGLISAGTRENKGIPARLTDKGRIVAEYVTMNAV